MSEIILHVGMDDELLDKLSRLKFENSRLKGVFSDQKYTIKMLEQYIKDTSSIDSLEKWLEGKDHMLYGEKGEIKTIFEREDPR